MSMVLCYLRVNEDEFDKIKESFEYLHKIFFNEDDSKVNSSLDIDKSWDGISFILCNYSRSSKHPFSKLFMGANTIHPGKHLGNGPTFFLTKDEVTFLSKKINEFSVEDFRKKFDAQKMMNAHIYPEIWLIDENALDYLLHYFEKIKRFLKDASSENQFVVMAMN